MANAMSYAMAHAISFVGGSGMSEGKSSSRRGFLAGAAVAGALTGSLAGGRSLVAPAQAAGETFELRMVTAWPKGAPGVGVNAERESRVGVAELVGHPKDGLARRHSSPRLWRA